MKALLSVSLVLLLIASCASNNNKKIYTVTDDHNGTKSPRVKEIVTKSADNNKSEETITQYTYNDQNLLISKKTSYMQKPKENEDTQDISEITYTYTQDKQLKTRDYKGSDLFNRGGSQTEYIYGDIIYEDTKLPVVDTVTITSRGGTCTYKHTYILNSSNHATSIDKITENSQIGDPGYVPQPDYNDTRVSGEPIYNKNTQKHTESNTGYLSKVVWSYNNGLLENKEYYTVSETNTSKYILEKTSYYHYENKPYYFKQSPTFIVDLPH